MSGRLVQADRAATPGPAITGAWEGSADGDRWTRDFAVSYAKLG
jgi:hypothetical protein